jgi:C4-dicarboxylate-specific signal transduction histidine kinase
MSTLGEMSAGIAHEINNPLAIILGKIEAMRTAMAAPILNRELLTRHVDTMERTANRIAKIVKGLRTFSRDGDQDPFEVTNVSEIVNEAVALCNSRFLNNGIELHVTNAPTELYIDARAVQISQVLLNLLNNAFDAVSELEEKWVRLEVRSAGVMLEFSVTDSGAGIPEEVRTKMTQPFFTTKEVGMGTGLGLSIASGIISAHGGTIEVDTISPNTRFVVQIPQVHAGVSSVA